MDTGLSVTVSMSRGLPRAAGLAGRPQTPVNERERLATLASFGVLDTPPDPALDELVRNTAEVCGVPMALVCLVDSQRVWCKARHGFELVETPRDLSFSAHAILSDDLFEVADAAADWRFRDHPQVVGGPRIRFFVGVPLRAREGHTIGTLCVLDRAPRRLNDLQRDALRAAARRVMGHLERQRRLHRLENVALARDLETVDRRPGADSDASASLTANLGRYTILSEIGRGAMATIYAAYDAELDRKIALKLIRRQSERVRHEAQALARISHPNVVQIYEIGAYGGRDFIAMELVDGVNLGTWQRIVQRDVYDIVDKYAQAGRGLAAAHGVGVVHRDFKPDNVVIDRRGRARVADFGLARVLDAGAGECGCGCNGGCGDAAGLTQRGAIIGTPAYMAPEQYDCPFVDARADQFSLCVSLYEAVYGVRPFAGATFAELRENALAGELQPAPPGVVVPETLRAVLLRGLAIDPAERWPSMDALVEQLEALDAQRDPGAAARERRRFVAALVAACLGGAALLAASGGAAEPSPALMLAVSSSILALGGLGLLLARKTLLRNRFHRKMIAVALTGTLSSVVARLVTALVDLSSREILTVEMLALGAIFAAAAPLHAPIFALNCAVMWIAALAVALGSPLMPVYNVAVTLVVLVFAASWSRVPGARGGRLTASAGGSTTRRSS